jgi:hypothetical protein
VPLNSKSPKRIRTEDGRLDSNPKKFSPGLSLPTYHTKIRTLVDGDSNDKFIKVAYQFISLYLNSVRDIHQYVLVFTVNLSKYIFHIF